MSKPRLRPAEFVHLAPETPGFVRVNHASPLCQGDSKSLRIVRKADGAIAADCYRCGATGYVPPSGHYRPSQRRVEDDETKDVDGFELPADATTDVRRWPAAAGAWLAKAGLGAEALARDGAQWSESTQTLYLPVLQETSAFGQKLVGWVLRGFDPKRYLTLTSQPASLWALRRGPDGHSGPGGTLVIVEDVLSAMRVAELTDALALLSVAIKPSAVAWVARERYKEAVVFLDGDNSEVRKAARVVARQLSFLPVRIIETGQDPKLLPKAELDKLIRPVYTGTTPQENT